MRISPLTSFIKMLSSLSHHQSFHCSFEELQARMGEPLDNKSVYKDLSTFLNNFFNKMKYDNR